MLVHDIDAAIPRQPPRVGLLTGQDLAVAAWTWTAFGRHPMFINRAFGLMEDGRLAGSIIFTEYNLFNVEMSYYAKDMPYTVFRFAARFAIQDLNVERLTIKIPRPHRRVGKGLLAIGAKVEGTLWCYYGRERTSQNAAVQYVLHRDALERIAGEAFRRARMN